jgi:hypothetical protein
MTKLISEPPPRSAIAAYLVQWHRGDGHYVSMCGQNGTSMASARSINITIGLAMRELIEYLKSREGTK